MQTSFFVYGLCSCSASVLFHRVAFQTHAPVCVICFRSKEKMHENVFGRPGYGTLASYNHNHKRSGWDLSEHLGLIVSLFLRALSSPELRPAKAYHMLTCQALSGALGVRGESHSPLGPSRSQVREREFPFFPESPETEESIHSVRLGIHVSSSV